MALHAAIKGKLLSVIGDEVSVIRVDDIECKRIFHLLIEFCNYFQDTCVGFLLGGIGEINKNRHPNFMVVDKSELLFVNSTEF